MTKEQAKDRSARLAELHELGYTFSTEALCVLADIMTLPDLVLSPCIFPGEHEELVFDASLQPYCRCDLELVWHNVKTKCRIDLTVPAAGLPMTLWWMDEDGMGDPVVLDRVEALAPYLAWVQEEEQ